MKLQPLTTFVVVKRVEMEAKSPAGIILPDSAKEESQLGDVVAVGGDVKGIKEGDRVLFKKYGPSTIKVDGDELIFLDTDPKEKEVLAVVK